jgi:autotransporter-associated beta strand protein
VFLGANNLTIGTNNLSTAFSGMIQHGANGGVGGSLTKIGASTLTLAGANTYAGPTTISGGTLQSANSLRHHERFAAMRDRDPAIGSVYVLKRLGGILEFVRVDGHRFVSDLALLDSQLRSRRRGGESREISVEPTVAFAKPHDVGLGPSADGSLGLAVAGERTAFVAAALIVEQNQIPVHQFDLVEHGSSPVGVRVSPADSNTSTSGRQEHQLNYKAPSPSFQESFSGEW